MAVTQRAQWNVPYQRNPFFTGREDVLSRLDRALHSKQRVALSQPQGITGLGGIGKTQTVVEYAYRHREEYDAVLWVRADSLSSLTSSVIELAHVLELAERNAQDQDAIVQAVLRWLCTHTNWLLIYDNIDDLSLAERFLPKAGAGHLLFTTRIHALGDLAQRLDLQQMAPKIGALLLLRRASLLALKATLNMAHPEEQRLAQGISQELDGFPLALDQAGAYIKETPCPLPQYLDLYRTRRRDILRVRGRFDQGYPASVATTWSLSFEKISEANPAAPELLNFCAFLAPDAISEELLTGGAAHLGDLLAPVVINPLQFDQVCKEVLRFSLLQRGPDEQTLTVHRLVQEVLRDGMSAETQRQWMQRAVGAVEASSPYDCADFTNWSRLERLLPHAFICTTWIEQAHLVLPEASRLLDGTGTYLQSRARYEEAEPLRKGALVLCEQQVGENHPDTSTAINNLATLYSELGKYQEVEILYQRALAICEQQVGENHPDIANSFNNLAILYSELGKYQEAEIFFQRALAIWQHLVGENHPDTASGLNNLAALYNKQGRYGEAEVLHKRALVIREQILGEDHLDTADSLGNLAEVYQAQGRYSEAEALCKRALAVRERALGATHPDTALGLNNLASLYYEQGKYSDAESLLRRSLAIFEQQLGPEHIYTIRCIDNIALFCQEQHKYSEAEALYKRALATWEQHMGGDHPDLATSLSNLGMLHYKRRKYREAKRTLKRALAIFQRKLGRKHPTTQMMRKQYRIVHLIYILDRTYQFWDKLRRSLKQEPRT